MTSHICFFFYFYQVCGFSGSSNLLSNYSIISLTSWERVWKNWYHFRSLFFLFISHKFILTFLNLHQLKSTLFKILHFILSAFNYTHICKVPTESSHRIHVHMYSLSLWDWVLSAEDIYDTLHSLLCSWTNLLGILNHDCGKQINDNCDNMKLREKRHPKW